MLGAFDGATFDYIAFDVGDIETEQHGSHLRNRKIDYGLYKAQVINEIERHEMKLSEELAKKLQEQIAFNQAMMQVNNNLLLANNNLLNVVSEIKEKADVVQQKPTMDADKKSALLLRLAEGKERKRREEEAKKKEMQKRMANVRKAKK